MPTGREWIAQGQKGEKGARTVGRQCQWTPAVMAEVERSRRKPDRLAELADGLDVGDEEMGMSP